MSLWARSIDARLTMSDEIEKHIRRRFDISQRLGKGVRSGARAAVRSRRRRVDRRCECAMARRSHRQRRRGRGDRWKADVVESGCDRSTMLLVAADAPSPRCHPPPRARRTRDARRRPRPLRPPSGVAVSARERSFCICRLHDHTRPRWWWWRLARARGASHHARARPAVSRGHHLIASSSAPGFAVVSSLSCRLASRPHCRGRLGLGRAAPAASPSPRRRRMGSCGKPWRSGTRRSSRSRSASTPSATRPTRSERTARLCECLSVTRSAPASRARAAATTTRECRRSSSARRRRRDEQHPRSTTGAVPSARHPRAAQQRAA